MSLRVVIRSEVKPIGVAVGKPSLNRAVKLRVADPKPVDLSMGRLKQR